jgi:hypothetical protein
MRAEEGIAQLEQENAQLRAELVESLTGSREQQTEQEEAS